MMIDGLAGSVHDAKLPAKAAICRLLEDLATWINKNLRKISQEIINLLKANILTITFHSPAAGCRRFSLTLESLLRK